MSRFTLWQVGFVVANFLPWPVFGSCAPTFPFCQKLPDRTDKTSAIFLGIVKSVTAPVDTDSTLARRRVGDPERTMEKRYPTARFLVTENFLGAEPAEFEVHMTSDVFLD